jgi:hypothetical protein
MLVMLCRNRVADFDAWRAVFDSHEAAHRAAGLRLTNLWRDVEDPGTVFFTFDVADLERARAFVGDPAAAEAGRASGVLDGELFFVTPVRATGRGRA